MKYLKDLPVIVGAVTVASVVMMAQIHAFVFTRAEAEALKTENDRQYQMLIEEIREAKIQINGRLDLMEARLFDEISKKK